MVEGILHIFLNEQKVASLLANPFIELIFSILFILFAITVVVHLALFGRLSRIQAFLETTKSLDISPINRFQAEYEMKKKQEKIKVETFVQKKFSSWRMFKVPVITLIKLVQMTVSLFILIGVLGTFIGLAMSLGSINGSGEQLVENVALVLAGLDVAFYTSIVGMGLSLIMTVLTRAANTEYMLTDIMLKVESVLDEAEEDQSARLIEVSESIHTAIIELKESNQESLQSIVTSFHGFQEYTVGLQQSAKDLASFNEGLSQNLKDFLVLFHHMKEVTNGFDDGVKKLNKNFDQLFSYFHNMDKRNERITSAFTETYQKINELSTSQSETLHLFQESVIDWKQYVQTIVERQEAIYRTFDRMTAQNDTLVKMMKENNQQFKSIFGNDVSSKLSGIQHYLGELKGDFQQLGHSVTRLPEALDSIHLAQKEYKHLLTERLTELKQFSQEFHQHLKNHVVQSQSFDKNLSDASRSYEQIGIKNNQLIGEVNRTISQMGEMFHQREQQLDASLVILKDTLSRYVATLGGNLGDKLEKISRAIGDYTIDMNEAVKKEFKQIGQIAEENQVRSARANQQAILQLSQEFQTLNRQLNQLSLEAQRVRVGSNDY